MNPEIITTIDAITINMSETGINILNMVLAFVMFGVALDIDPQIFKHILRKPKSIVLGILCQTILLPCLTFLLVILINDWISPMLALGMILVASCPGGNISNFITSLSKGNTELSVSLTAVNTIACIFTTPLNFGFWGALYLRFAGKRLALPELSIPFGEIFNTIVILLGIPLALGMLFSHYKPQWTARLKQPFQHLSIAFFIAIVVLTFGNNVYAFLQCIRYIFVVVLLHNILALGIGYGISRMFRLPRKDRKTLTIETGIQNSGLGLVLLFNPDIFRPDIWAGNGGMLVITAWWGVWHIVSGLTLAFCWRRKDGQ